MVETLSEVEKLKIRPVQVATYLPGELAIRMKDYARARKLTISAVVATAVGLLLAEDEVVP